MLQWTHADKRVSVPGRRHWVKLGTTLYDILAALETWTDIDDLMSRSIAPEAVIREAVDRLAAFGLIDVDAEPATPRVWQFWGPIARRFHVESRDATYPATADERRELAESIAASEPPPDIFKSYPANPVVQLPRSHAPLEMPVGEALMRRRTHRHFENIPVEVDDLSTVLHYTFAPQRFADSACSMSSRCERAHRRADATRWSAT